MRRGGTGRRLITRAIAGVAVCGLGWVVMNGVLSRKITSGLTELVGVRAGIGALQFNPFSGRIVLRDAFLENPPGFRTTEALRFATVEARVEPKSLLRDVIVIDSVAARGGILTYERTRSGDNWTAFIAAASSADSPHGSHSNGKSHGGRRIVLRSFVLSDTRLEFLFDPFSDERSTMILPEFSVNALGEAEGGLPPRAILERIASALRSRAGLNVEGLRSLAQPQ